jgi:hypothetical protein
VRAAPHVAFVDGIAVDHAPSAASLLMSAKL